MTGQGERQGRGEGGGVGAGGAWWSGEPFVCVCFGLTNIPQVYRYTRSSSVLYPTGTYLGVFRVYLM